MGDEFNAGKYGGIVALVFGVANAATSKTAEDLTFSDATYNNTLATMPKGGSVVGVSVQASAAVTAGSVTFAAHKDGTEFAQSGFPNPELESVTNDTESYASIRPGVLTFDAGNALGVSYTSDATLAPTNTNDFAAILWVQMDPN